MTSILANPLAGMLPMATWATLDPSSTSPGPLQGAALLGLVVAGGGLGILLIVVVAWSRRRRATRRAGRGGRSTSIDPWRESARRIQTDPEDGSPWPPVDPRRQDS